MELEYVARAVRRFWPIVVLSVVLGIALGLLLRPNTTPRYESAALVLIHPTGDANVAGDRYLSSQLVLLESPPMAARANDIAKLNLSDEAMRSSVAFFQIPGTDVIRIIGFSSLRENASVIANAYVDAYLAYSEDAASGAEPDAAALDASIEEIEQKLNELDQQLANLMKPYVDKQAESGVEVPGIEQVAPALATERDVLLEQLGDLLRRQASADFDPPTVSGGSVIQRAQLPITATASSSRLFVLAVPLALLLMGIAGVTALARASRRVLDRTEASEILGVPFASVIRQERSLSDGSLAHLCDLPEEFRVTVNELGVQAEAQHSAGSALAVLVTGSQRLAGTSTLAAALAARFGENGARVVLLDLDFGNPDLAEYFEVHDDSFSRLLALLPPTAAARGEGARAADVFTPTPMHNVSVVGRRRDLELALPLRGDLLVALDTASAYADVVIIDAGPALAASPAAVLAQHVDAVVLAIPVSVQQRSPLRLVARQVAPFRSHLLTVAMPRLRSPRKWLPRVPGRPSAAHPELGELAPFEEQHDSALR